MAHYMLWLLGGVVCLAAEAVGINGIGMLFAGLGALTTGSIVTIYPELDILYQWIIFFAATSLWAIFLWKPLKQFRSTVSKTPFKNMIGDVAFIGVAGLQKNMVGEATWSGTIMRAELAEGAEPIAPGSQATIVAVAGNTLIVKPR